MAERFDLERWLRDRADLFLFGHHCSRKAIHHHLGCEPEPKLRNCVFYREPASSVFGVYDLYRPYWYAKFDFRRHGPSRLQADSAGVISVGRARRRKTRCRKQTEDKEAA